MNFGQSSNLIVTQPQESAGLTLGTCVGTGPIWTGYGCFGSYCGSSCFGAYCAG